MYMKYLQSAEADFWSSLWSLVHKWNLSRASRIHKTVRLSANCTCEIRHTLNIVVSTTTDSKRPQNLNHPKDTAAAVNTGEADCG